jgi:hypothetical protein
MFKTTVVEKIKTHFIFNNFFPERRGVYDTMREGGTKSSTAGQSTDDNTVRRRKDAISVPDN